ncbi:MAG: EAL domain-containing protein [Gammaproteobacteria bacterium]|nr:EAL domain-containing protein [Gammaproteobacteria bacterium]MBU0786176.1 EAL domain-containing protein [Gammaproteobacteria bacterium]MBU0816757.1 EAL domain-containing protein [Gammaproteobacteria bacterium]MBU1786921.1 EAL domain-containing protein [Gammaproteobacteria bacterium]
MNTNSSAGATPGPSGQHMATILQSITDAIVMLDPNWCFTYVNEKAGQLLQRQPADLLGKNIWKEFPESVHQPYYTALHQAFDQQQSAALQLHYPSLATWCACRVYPNRDGLSLFFHDITDYKLAEALHEGQRETLEMIAQGAPLAATLDVLLRFLERQNPDMLCSLLLLDPDGIHVRHGAGPSLPQAFIDAIDGQPIGPNAGSCGTAAYLGESVMVEDIATDPRWRAYKAAALPHGLRACWSTPIFDIQQQVLGTFAIYYQQPGRPSRLHQHCIDVATHIAAIAISRARAESRLRASEERFRGTLDGMFEGVQLIGFDWRYLYLNETAARHNRRPNEELLGKTMSEAWPSLKSSQVSLLMKRGLEERTAQHAEIEFVFPDASLGWYDVQCLPVREGICVLSVDISERKKAQARLELAASVFTNAREGILITDANGDIVDVNAAFTEITGFSREEALGKNPRALLHSGRQGPAFYDARMKLLLEQGHWTGEVWNRRKNGEIYPEHLTISLVRDNEGQTKNYVALFTDITAIKEQQRQLEHFAHYDALTGLPNRVLLADRLKLAMTQSMRSGQFLAVAFLDLDGFKAVNDQHGHAIGDALLIALSQRMKTALREGDSLARMGGDEFVAVLVGLDEPQDAEPILARLLQATAEPTPVGSALLQVSASIGVTMYPKDHVDADQLLRHADQAMFIAKQTGKNQIHLFDVAHDVAMQSRQASLRFIQLALNGDEFVLHYQPKVNMRTGEIVGAEALIRWQHPIQGLLPPVAFLPIIEGRRISVAVGEWVIASALRQMSEWKAQGLDIPVSVNIGALQLQSEGFPNRLAELLASTPEISPDWLELEILETSALEDIAQVSGVMSAIQALGVRFALDDFGTGYSSLTYLKSLPVERLKIDQSFVRDMLIDRDDRAIVLGVIGLARAFEREVIAEGVESIAHGEMLLSLGCDLAQGYGIARPMPASELPRWVRHWRPVAAWTTSQA